ncbi:Sua5/YciO/YrdC/YwlC family protein, partial [Candidatus Saccharibacteria bacterium]|nr:Sua5/YciO/YrdC/YwlC family protein [Candidatus Saccharibacteria bacterium]
MRELDHAADILMSGGTVIFPTDTVLGLGAHALKKDAIEKIYEIKGRDRNKPINILISDIDKLASLVEPLNKIEEKLAETFWPG